MRTVLVGSGFVGRKHLAALENSDSCLLVGIVEPASDRRLPVACPTWADLGTALAALNPDLVIVTAPPPASLPLARQAAVMGATVLVEKPVLIDSTGWADRPGDERIYVAFQPHMAPGVAGLLARPPQFKRAEVDLVCRRDPVYFRGWRRCWHQAGGVLHQQAIHGIALALRLTPGASVAKANTRTWHTRGYSDAEDAIDAELLLTTGHRITLRGRTDASTDLHRRHEVRLRTTAATTVTVTGHNLEAGLGPPADAPDDGALRQALYRAMATHAAGGARHPGLFGLRELPRILEMINHVYRDAQRIPR